MKSAHKGLFVVAIVAACASSWTILETVRGKQGIEELFLVIRIEAEDAGRKPGDESLPSRRLGWRSQIGFLIC